MSTCATICELSRPSPRASLRYLCGLSVSASYSSFSSSPKPNLDRSASALNSHGIISFADHHPLNPVASILYKNSGGRGCLTKGTGRSHIVQFCRNTSPLDATLTEMPASVDSKQLKQSLSPLNATLTKNIGVGGAPDLCLSLLPYLLTSLPRLISGRKESCRYNGPHFKRSPCSCNTAASAAPDGTSVKLVTACGDSPAGPAPTTPNRSTPCSAPWISAAISLTPRGLTAKAAANRSSEKFCAPTRARDFTSPRKFRPKILSGPAAVISPSTIAIRRTTSKSTSTKASPISASKNSTSSNFILGKIAGSTTNASRAWWKSCAPAAKPKPWASASIAGSPATAFAPCSKASPTPSRSSTTFSTKIPKTRSFPSVA